MERLGLNELSIILSFLTETEGTSVLLTKKHYAQFVLPVFRLKGGPVDSLLVVNGRKPAIHRHKFLPVPIQNSSVLLARLNTKRLFRRKQRLEKGWTSEELARREWTQMQASPDDTASWNPPFLELLRFLDDQDQFRQQVQQQTILVSYPRSGNTLIRTLLERMTGFVTGSDTRPDRNLSRALAEQHDLVGEGVFHSSLVRIVKTHWPERSGNAFYTARRAILVVRNPYDAIDSYWNMSATCTHTKSLTQEVYDQFRDKFERLVRNEMEIWLRFHEYWIAQSDVPVWVVRYENLVQDPAHEMKQVLQFILQENHLSPFWQHRVQHVTSASAVNRLGSYQPRPGSSTVGKSLHKGHFKADLVQYIHECAASRQYSTNYLVDFGYDQMKHDFPQNFAANGPPPALPSHLRVCANRTGSVRVNSDASLELRAKDCEFGRALQKWRWSVTNYGAEPLPTVE